MNNALTSNDWAPCVYRAANVNNDKGFTGADVVLVNGWLGDTANKTINQTTGKIN